MEILFLNKLTGTLAENLRLWIPTKTVKDPLERVRYRMNVFFWVKKWVYLPVDRETKSRLRMFSNPNRKEPLTGEYFLKHSEVFDKEGSRVKVTQYRGSGLKYLRHKYIGAGGTNESQG